MIGIVYNGLALMGISAAGQYMATAGLDVITLWNNGVDLSAANAQSYATNVPSLLGLTIQQDSVARQWVTSSLPLDVFFVTYGSAEVPIETGPPGPGVTPAVVQFDVSRPAMHTSRCSTCSWLRDPAYPAQAANAKQKQYSRLETHVSPRQVSACTPEKALETVASGLRP